MFDISVKYYDFSYSLELDSCIYLTKNSNQNITVYIINTSVQKLIFCFLHSEVCFLRPSVFSLSLKKLKTNLLFYKLKCIVKNKQQKK